MSIYIIHASINENGKITGGKPGDQTGKEVCMRKWYSKPWDYYIACTDEDLADRAAELFEEVAVSDICGYCQGDRLSLYDELVRCKGIVSKMKKCSADCSSAVAAIYKFLGVPISASCTTRNINEALSGTGKFNTYSDPLCTDSYRYAHRGGLYLKEGSHIVMARDNGDEYKKIIGFKTCSDLIKAGQQHAVDFTGASIKVDGNAGKETRKMKHRVLQRAMNLDYNACLDEDGNVGAKSRKALGSHYVKKGNRQYMVTAAEILMLLNGIDPNGVEFPGHYGGGLTKAAKKKFGGDGSRISSDEFLKLIA